MIDIQFTPRARHDISQILKYFSTYDEQYANRQISALDDIFDDLGKHPYLWTYFFITGAPYRARLFSPGRRTAYWIVYRVTESEKIVKIYRVWSTARDPDAFRL